jgi:hypothetical protein
MLSGIGKVTDQSMVDSCGNQTKMTHVGVSGIQRKVQLAAVIMRTIQTRGWTLQHAADVLGTSVGTLSNLRHGRYDKVSLTTMLAFEVKLGR